MSHHSFNRTGQEGFSHIIAVVAVLVVFGAIGAFFVVRSHAATCRSYTYRRGGTGQCVRNIQTMLNSLSLGQDITVDGSFGPNTQLMVKRFQATAKLNPDGVVGPNTWAEFCFPAGLKMDNASRYNTAAKASGCPNRG